MSSSAVSSPRPLLSSRSTHTSPRTSTSTSTASLSPSPPHDNGTVLERRKDSEQRSSRSSSTNPVASTNLASSAAPLHSSISSSALPKMPSSSSSTAQQQQQQQQQRGEELKQSHSSPSVVSSTTVSSSSSARRHQLTHGSHSFNNSYGVSPASSSSTSSHNHHHRTSSSSSTPSSAASSSASSAASTSRRSPLPGPITTTTSTASSPSPPPGPATTNSTPTSSTCIPPNPLDNDNLLALIGLRKFQYMQTFIQSDPTPALILPNLYLGSIGAARNLKFLQQRRITHILTIGNNLPVFFRGQFEYLHLVVQDGEKEDIRRHFERCVRFVERGRGGLGEVTGHKLTAAKGQAGAEEEKREAEVELEAGLEEKKEKKPAASSSATACGEDGTDGSGKRVDGEGTTAGTGVLLHCFAGRSRSVTILLAYLLTLVHRNPPTHPDIQCMMKALDLSPTANGSPTATATTTTAAAVTSPSSSPPAYPTPLTLSRLFDYVKLKRPEIKPNAGFVAQLLLLERELSSVSYHLAQLHIGGRTASSEVEAAVMGVGRVGEGEVGEVERQRANEVESMAGKERGQEWRKF